MGEANAGVWGRSSQLPEANRGLREASSCWRLVLEAKASATGGNGVWVRSSQRLAIFTIVQQK